MNYRKHYEIKTNRSTATRLQSVDPASVPVPFLVANRFLLISVRT